MNAWNWSKGDARDDAWTGVRIGGGDLGGSSRRRRHCPKGGPDALTDGDRENHSKQAPGPSGGETHGCEIRAGKEIPSDLAGRAVARVLQFCSDDFQGQAPTPLEQIAAQADVVEKAVATRKELAAQPGLVKIGTAAGGDRLDDFIDSDIAFTSQTILRRTWMRGSPPMQFRATLVACTA